MFFHSVKEGAVGLSVVLGRVVKTADLVDGVGRQRGWRGGLRPGGVISDVFLSMDSDSIRIFGLYRSGGPKSAENADFPKVDFSAQELIFGPKIGH